MQHNALDPIRMTPAERLNEIAEILAVGIIRLQSSGQSANQRDSSLDFTANQSMHGHDINDHGESK
ncbi:MAG: hypothetical protein HOB79_19280 [Rhodospirillaceae bacterium]|jgi:hypothetical protein|nr:hypothetical protein [Rhodospirillales bacterium]MBT4703221.1 hypothetical protein [Rhodospirillaceae bacterium]